MRCIFLAFLLLTGACANAQDPYPVFQPFQQIKAFFSLTDAQVTQIVGNLNDYSRLVSQRQSRVIQVQNEITQETAKSPLDPAALGIRYAEIETICRNVRDEATAVQNRNLALLTDAQKAKLKVLDDALKLQPIIAEAQSAGVLASSAPYSVISSQWFNTNGLFLPATLPGCQQVYNHQ